MGRQLHRRDAFVKGSFHFDGCIGPYVVLLACIYIVLGSLAMNEILAIGTVLHLLNTIAIAWSLRNVLSYYHGYRVLSYVIAMRVLLHGCHHQDHTAEKNRDHLQIFKKK